MIAMGGAERRRWRAPLRTIGIALLAGLIAAVNLWLAARSIGLILDGAPAVDWVQLLEAGRRVTEGGLYEVTETYAHPHSPLLAYVLMVLPWLETPLWRVGHLIAAMAMPTWPMRLATVVSWPFWYDVETGNALTFVLLAAAWAVRGSRIGTGAFFAMTILMPRPLMLPVAAWLLWKRPAWRAPIIIAVGVSAGLVVLSGWADDWAGYLLGISTHFQSPNNLGPTRFVGAIWLVVAIPLTVWLVRRGHLGWASLTSSYPYLYPYYFLMLVLEVRRWSLSHRPAGSVAE